jgi:hypothetical protein
MKIGFALPNIGPVVTAEAVVKVAQRAKARNLAAPVERFSPL